MSALDITVALSRLIVEQQEQIIKLTNNIEDLSSVVLHLNASHIETKNRVAALESRIEIIFARLKEIL